MGKKDFVNDLFVMLIIKSLILVCIVTFIILKSNTLKNAGDVELNPGPL